MSKLREARIDGEFRRALGELLLTELKDPRMSKMASVSKVSVTQDLKYAKVDVAPCCFQSVVVVSPLDGHG